jgi:hypothetical protein
VDRDVGVAFKFIWHEQEMKNCWQEIARAITSFVENPVTNLVKGIALLLIGVSEASHTFREDVAHGHVRVGHGIIIIGIFSVLDAVPHVIEGLNASRRFLEHQAKKGEATNETGKP